MYSKLQKERIAFAEEHGLEWGVSGNGGVRIHHSDESLLIRLKQLFIYKEGFLIKISNGERLEGAKLKRYRTANIDNKGYLTHRLIFLFEKGFLPRFVDHEDGDPSNNRIRNLREATQQQNNQNTKSRKNSTSIYLGVSWFKRDGRWKSQIQVNGKMKHIGCFDDEVEAAKARDLASIEYFGEFAKLNFPV